jgi:hypothetical protein
MISPDSRDRLVLLVVGVLVLLGPVLILVLTLGTLILFGDLAVGEITPVEFLELYILDLLLFVVLAYGIYRLTLWMVEHRLPVALDAIEVREEDDTPNEESDTGSKSDSESTDRR